MCAMIPMLRTWARALCTSVVIGKRSPAVVGEGLVGLSHLVGVLTPLDAGAEAVARVEQLVHEPLGHGLLATLPAVADQPTQGERGRARRLHLDRHLVGRA